MIRASMVALISLVSIAASAQTNSASTKIAQVEERSAKWEIRTAPIALLASWLTIDAGYRIGSKVSTGPAFVSYGAKSGNMFLPSFEGQAIGWYANYYFRPSGVGGWYTSLHAYAEDYLVHSHSARDGERFKRAGTRANAAIGFHRTAKSIDFLIGGGIQVMDHEVERTKFVSTSMTGPERLESTNRRETHSVPFVEFKTGLRF